MINAAAIVILQNIFLPFFTNSVGNLRPSE
jgi:hypothetical protein